MLLKAEPGWLAEVHDAVGKRLLPVEFWLSVVAVGAQGIQTAVTPVVYLDGRLQPVNGRLIRPGDVS